MAKELTKKQKAFANEYIDTGNGTRSALVAYDTDDEKTAGVIASQNLGKLSIKEYIEEQSTDAVSRIVELSINAKNETVKLNANKDILDRGGYGAVEKSQALNVNINGHLSENPKTEAVLTEFEEKLKQSFIE